MPLAGGRVSLAPDKPADRIIKRQAGDAADADPIASVHRVIPVPPFFYAFVSDRQLGAISAVGAYKPGEFAASVLLDGLTIDVAAIFAAAND